MGEQKLSHLFCTDIEDVVPIPDTKTSFAQFYLDSISKFPQSWIVDVATNRKTTYDQLEINIRAFSSNLLKKGYKKGDILCILSKNCTEYITCLVGCSLAHVTISPANPAYTAEELLYQLRVSQSKSIFIQSGLLDTLENAIELSHQKKDELHLQEVFLLDPFSESPSTVGGIPVIPFELLMDRRNDFMEPQTEVNPKEDVWLLPFSSGTTGLPKGVCLTHFNMIANITQFIHYKSIMNVDSSSTFLAVLPMYHIYGLYMFALGGPMRGAKIILLPHFEPTMFLSSIEQYKTTHLHIVPPLVLFLGKDPRVEQYDLSSIQDLVSAAAPLAEDVAVETVERLRTKCHAHNISFIRQAWGMTELSPVGTVARFGQINPSFGSIGPPVPFTEIKVVDAESPQKLLPLGQEGELCLKGPQVMKGYFNNEEATRNCIDKEGWLLTGDMAKIDSPTELYITDRLKELIKTKGFQVAPAELEGLILTHPSIQDCCVFGVPHDTLGEAPSVAVVMKPGKTLTEKQVKELVSKNAAPYKQLAGGVRFVDQIPKTASGKILRRVLKARFL